MNTLLIYIYKTVYHQLYKVIIIIILCLTSCQDVPTSPNTAIKLNISDISNTMGYEWFDNSYNDYNPNITWTKKIDSVFNPSTARFIIFATPSNSCRSTQDLFPIYLKILKSAGIDDANIEVYSMSNLDASQPYSKYFTITDFPDLYLMKNSLKFISITDIHNSLNPNGGDSITYEEIIYDYLI